MDNEPVVLSRYLAKCGLVSRRGAAQWIADGRVRVNSEVVREPGRRVVPGVDHVSVDGRPAVVEAHTYLMLNKPPGYTCSASDPHADKLAVDLLRDVPERVFSIGRLDRDSEGLLLFTNDGELANQLAHPRYQVRKSYRVDVVGAVTPELLKELISGIEDDGERLSAESAEIACQSGDMATLQIVLNEGRKREIRRMCRHCGWSVRRLQRTRFGPLDLGPLAPGEWRLLTAREVATLTDTPTLS
jgi:23S rRNA pseudouridine2605 synthase